MFLDFFYLLRGEGVPCTTSEYLDLLKAMEGLQDSGEHFNAEKFYLLARSCLVKDIKYYDKYDVAFAKAFKDLIESDSKFNQLLSDWLKNAVAKKLSQQRKDNALKIPPANLLKELKKRLEEQKKRHDTGNKWIGTGGTSPFGNSGYNPGGLRIGGQAQNRSAMAVVGERIYQEYRTDETFNLRQIKMALKKLRSLRKQGRPQIEINKSIKKTCDNAGEIDLVFEKDRKNSMKLILLMDVGGSMTPFARNVSKLFSSAHQINHFKQFKYYYFHNVFYDQVYADASFTKPVSVDKLIRKFDSDTRVIIVGDAYMAPYELFQMTGSLREFYFTLDETKQGSNKTGMERIEQWSKHFPKSIWLNPEPARTWQLAPTINAVKSNIKMFGLTVDGLSKAIKFLKT
jgi:uncharacterized protein